MAYVEDVPTEWLERFIKNDRPISLYYTQVDGERVVTTIENKVQKNGKTLTEDDDFLKEWRPALSDPGARSPEFICNISVEEMKEELLKR